MNENLLKYRNPFHIIPKIQFPFQIRCIIHYIKGLTFDRLMVDSTNVIKHDIEFYLNNIYIFNFFIVEQKFQIQSLCEEKMYHLLKIAQMGESTLSPPKIVLISFYKKIGKYMDITFWIILVC